jgi:AGCS family alanine or glycine:cation symporter
MLSGVVVWLSKDYNAQNKQGVLPTFDKDKHPKLAKEVDPNAWK